MSGVGELHHVGITVRDMDESVAWYTRMFGTTCEFRATSSGAQLSTAVGVPDAQLELAFLRFGGSSIELLKYSNPRRESNERSNADVGSTHVCLHVDDIHQSYEEMKARGVAFLAEPLLIDEGPLAGCSFVYFKDPNGVTLELFQVPTPKS
ncbi:MAG: lactoylglutathione lyase [Nocardioidaceae bacterium]|nr:lactoylglutathione lyase [Nocardioidaceae bacterium]